MARRVQVLSAGAAAILRDPAVLAMLEEKMGPVLDAAIASAPVASGAHRASLHIEGAIEKRAVARVVADTDHSLGVEARTGHMARALDQAR